MAYEFLPFVKEERKLFFSLGDLSEEYGMVGYLRGDFGSGDDFYSNWFDGQINLKTDAFRKEFYDVVNYMRSNPEKPVLKSRSNMFNYSHENDVLRIFDDPENITFGFKIKTQSYSYYVRCKPSNREYYFYIFCFDNRHLYDGYQKDASDLSVFLDKIINPENAKEIYSVLNKFGVDKDGWDLYCAAKEITNFNVCSFFSGEDNMGRFEVMNGLRLFRWLEIGAFGEIEWDHSRPPYEIYKSHKMDYTSPDYLAFQATLFPLAVKRAVEEFGKTNPSCDFIVAEKQRIINRIATALKNKELEG